MPTGVSQQELAKIDALIQAHPEASKVLTPWIKAEYDLKKLRECVVRILRASQTFFLTRQELRNAAGVLASAGDELRKLRQWTECRQLLSGTGIENPESWPSTTGKHLNILANKLTENYVPKAKVSENPARLDRAKCRLLRQYRLHAKNSAKFYDAQLALLIEAVTGQNYSEEAQRKWRQRHFKGRSADHVCP